MKPNRSIPSAAVVPVLVYPDVRDFISKFDRTDAKR